MTLSSTEPTALTAGDTISWSRADLLAEHPGAVLTYTFVGASNPVSVTADASFTATLSGATTAPMAAGFWRWSAAVTLGGARMTVGTGTLKVSADPTIATGPTDVRSHAVKVLEAIEATLEGRASQAHASVTMADGRAVTSLSPDQLIRFREVYRREVVAAERVSKGRSRNILARF